MDLSKLPRLSKTPTAPADPAPVDASPIPGAAGAVPTATPAMKPCPYCAAPVRTDARFCDACGAQLGRMTATDQVGIGIDVWMMAILGLIFILVGRDFARFEFSRLTHREYHTGYYWPNEPPHSGEEVEYPELSGMVIWNDSAMFLFGVVMILDGLARAYAALGLPGRRGMVAATLLLTAVMTLYNGYVAIKVFNVGIIPLFSILAVGIGGFLAYLQWLLLMELRVKRAAAPV